MKVIEIKSHRDTNAISSNCEKKSGDLESEIVIILFMYVFTNYSIVCVILFLIFIRKDYL
jgi:hypothetical protein